MPEIIRIINASVLRHVRCFEMGGVLMRIFSFGLLAWMGKESPLMLIWTINTVDAIVLSWCAMLRRDPSYILLNVFWIGVGVLGLVRAYSAAV